ncbi:MAG TPA: nicotinate phosphoribosyltransferase [Acidimicrobiales bacterium]|nr:nicotinate phosphoribosyltransferase [Acidimicrobiales bacterium]
MIDGSGIDGSGIDGSGTDGSGTGGSPAAPRVPDAPPGAVLATDLYELNMAASYLARGMSGEATFSCFVRRFPEGRGFLVACGLEDVLEFLDGLCFGDADLADLARIGLPDDTLEAFATLRFSGDVLAAPEGSILAPDEPLLEVTAPIAEAQLVETYVLNQLTFQSAVATKAARCQIAAAGRIGLVEFGLRRAHGREAGLAVSRAAGIAGFEATSNVEAAARYGLVAAGTMAHSYVESFPTELDAFLAFGGQFPDRSTFLVDTYDTLTGVDHAIEAIEALGLSGRASIRIDSGDLAGLARAARRRLDAAGLSAVHIFASGNLDEHGLARLVATGAPVDGAGIGTRLAVSSDAPYLESVYKLVAYEGRPVAKQSAGKATLPGAKQVFRGPGLTDVLALRHEEAPEGSEPLLVPVIRGGRRVGPRPSPSEALAAARQRFESDLAQLPEPARRLEEPRVLRARLSGPLRALAEEVRAGAGGGTPAHSSAGTAGDE